MDKIKKKIYIAVVSSLLTVLVALGGVIGYFQNQINQLEQGKLKGMSYQNAVSYTSSAPATTTRSYMTPGTATTTLSTHAGLYGDLALGVQFTASTSPAILNIKFEGSDNQIDWYPLAGLPTTVAVSQGTLEVASTTLSYNWQPGSLTASTSMLLLPVPTVVADYVRAVATLPATSSAISTQMNGAVWMEFAHRED